MNWTKLPGTAERYISPSGETVSKRTYYNERATETGYHTYSEMQRTKPSTGAGRSLAPPPLVTTAGGRSNEPHMLSGASSDYHRSPGKSERYTGPTGATVSKREFYNAVRREQGFTSQAGYLHTRKHDAEYIQQEKTFFGIAHRYHPELKRAEVADLIAKAGATGFGKTPNSNLPGGPMANLLEAIGLRVSGAAYSVGESPDLNQQEIISQSTDYVLDYYAALIMRSIT